MNMICNGRYPLYDSLKRGLTLVGLGLCHLNFLLLLNDAGIQYSFDSIMEQAYPHERRKANKESV